MHLVTVGSCRDVTNWPNHTYHSQGGEFQSKKRSAQPGNKQHKLTGTSGIIQDTPPKTNMDTKKSLGLKGNSSSKPLCLGSMLVFRSVDASESRTLSEKKLLRGGSLIPPVVVQQEFVLIPVRVSSNSYEVEVCINFNAVYINDRSQRIHVWYIYLHEWLIFMVICR